MWVAADPWALSDRMRERLRAAVVQLLADPGLTGAPDSVRLAVVVAAAKTNLGDQYAVLTVGEMGRWLGVSASQVSQTVRPLLQRGPVHSVVARREDGDQRLGLRWSVTAMLQAWRTGRPDDPLRLTRPELATLLRLVEALFAPGWASTAPGLVAWRTGHGAAALRLALLLLVMHARPDGSVRLCGGAVDARGRLAATVARLLGCDTAAGEQVLAELVACGAVDIRPGGGRERLIVPEVARAHRGLRREREAGRSPLSRRASGGGRAGGPGADGAQSESGGGYGQVQERAWEPDAPGGRSVRGDQMLALDASLLVSPYKAADFDPAVSVALHAGHSPVVEVSGEAGVKSRCSGEADGPVTVDGRKRARPREDHGVGQAGVQAEALGGPVGPLRGEQPDFPPADQHQNTADTARTSWRKARLAAPPADVAAVLEVVRPLWDRITRPGAQQRVIAAVRCAKAEVVNTAWADTTPQPDQAVTARLLARLAESGGTAAVADPVGWLLRALRRRSSRHCPELRCDDGTLMDTGGPCGACQSRIEARGAVRAAYAAEVAATLPPTAPKAQRRAEVERLMRELTDGQARTEARDAGQRAEQRAAFAEEREADAIRTRKEQAAAERERLARPCEVCGAPQSAGLCAGCGEQRRTEQLIADTVTVAVAAWAGPDQEALSARIDSEIRTRIEQATEAARCLGARPELLPTSARWEAAAVAEEYRRSALAHLARSRAATAEARLAAEACLHDRHPSLAAARAAADQAGAAAREQAAAALLQDRLTRLRALRARGGPAWNVGEEDLCVDGCGRIALLSGPRCRRCHAGAVPAAARASAAPAGVPTQDAAALCQGDGRRPCGRPAQADGYCARHLIAIRTETGRTVPGWAQLDDAPPGASSGRCGAGGPLETSSPGNETSVRISMLEGDVAAGTDTQIRESSFTTHAGTVSWAPTTGGAQ